MRTIVFVAVSMALECGCLVAQPVQISQTSIMNSGFNRFTGGYPFVISFPGSYQLSGDLTVPANVDGIVIASSNVTLDLNGWTIFCQGPDNTVARAITLPPSGALSMITVRNGGVVGPNGFNFEGVILSNGFSSGITVQDLTANGGRIQTDSNSILRHNIATGQISAVCPSIITENVSTGAGVVVGVNVGGSNPPNCVFWNNRDNFNFTRLVSQ